MKNKKMLLAIIAVVILVGVLAGVYFATRPDAQEGKKTFTVTVVHADGKTKDFTYTTTEKCLGPVLLREELISGNNGPYGLEIHTVDGERAVYDLDRAYWALYEGEAYANQGIDTTPVLDGAIYKLVFTRA